MFPLVEGSLSSNRLRVARIISFLWRNKDWLSSSSCIPAFPIIDDATSDQILERLAEIAALTPVKEDNIPNGPPPIVREAFELTLERQEDHEDSALILQKVLIIVRQKLGMEEIPEKISHNKSDRAAKMEAGLAHNAGEEATEDERKLQSQGQVVGE